MHEQMKAGEDEMHLSAFSRTAEQQGPPPTEPVQCSEPKTNTSMGTHTFTHIYTYIYIYNIHGHGRLSSSGLPGNSAK
jgi:hypothetical protein